MADSFMAASRELGRYKLDVVGEQKVRWDIGGTVTAGKEENQQLRTGFI